MTGTTGKHSNRPHCLYLWYIHGMPVCSEEKSNRECPYPFWKCPVRDLQNTGINGNVSASSVKVPKISVKI
ncbi:hypothetical protein ACKUB1_10880 [Methanospirillum stamsii]|uniref:hypothetical protein n=1 Tax=Methanospirillum stamsii TaxID=1277351 RepID=UPI0011B26697|nr:hypothetical protein [Methanospirillum stamsii]